MVERRRGGSARTAGARRFTIPTLVAVAIAIAGCDGDDEPGPRAVEYARLGGVAGVGERLTITEGGEATVTIGFGPEAKVESFQVPPDELARLTEHLSEVEFGAIDTGTSDTCADCFLYGLEFGEETATADSTTIEEEFSQATEPLELLIANRGPSRLPDEGVLLDFNREGGLAFSIYDVRIYADGTGTVATGNNPEQLDERSFEVSGPEIDELREILDANPLAAIPNPYEEVCADCFEYELAYGGGLYTYSSADEVPAGVAEVTSFLGELPLPPDQPR